MREDLPEPETPVTTTNFPRGTATSRFLRLFSRAPRMTTSVAVSGAAGLGGGDAAPAGEVGAGDALLTVEDGAQRSLGDDVAAVAACFGAEVDNVVGGAHHGLVVLDNHDGVPEVAQALKGADEAVAVDRVEADGGLVADVEDAHKGGPDLGGETDALGLAPGERAGSPVEREVLQPDVDEELQA